MRIGLLCIATKRYVEFIKPLYDSMKAHFMPGQEVTMFVFTDREKELLPPDAVRIEQPHLPWPGPTLFRYDMFVRNRKAFEDMDYVYYCDADMRFVDTVGSEAIGSLVATIHPGFYNKPRHLWTYEKRPESKACMGPNEGFAYFAGGFLGGRTPTFLKMAETLKGWIEEDQAKGITPLWHDESMSNRYFFLNPPANVLTPSYCYPEGGSIPFKKRLIALNKNHHDLRFN